MLLVKVKLRGSNTVVNLMPNIAYARINGGTATLVDDPNERLGLKAGAKVETATPAKPTETSDAPAQTVTTPKQDPPAEAKKPAKAAETKSRR